MSKPDTYAAAPKEIRDAVEQLIKEYGPDPSLLAGALVAATTRAILAAEKRGEEREREACAILVGEEPLETYATLAASRQAADHRARMSSAIRERGEP